MTPLLKSREPAEAVPHDVSDGDFSGHKQPGVYPASPSIHELAKMVLYKKAGIFLVRLKIDKLTEVTVEAMTLDQVTMTDLARRQPHPYNLCMAKDEYNFFNSHTVSL